MSDSANAKTANTGAAAQASGANQFWAGVKQEFRKIIWPNKPTLISRSTCVVVVSICLGAIIAVIDRIILYLINFMVK
jgi:preprotein translocase subunit SecE